MLVRIIWLHVNTVFVNIYFPGHTLVYCDILLLIKVILPLQVKQRVQTSKLGRN